MRCERLHCERYVLFENNVEAMRARGIIVLVKSN